MKLHEIDSVTEVRKNPKSNRKTSINQEILKRLSDTTDRLAGVKNLFVSFTSLEKLGINPGSEDRTPIGIYSYPAEYVANQTGEYFDPAEAMPYAGDRPWVNVFEMSGRFVSLRMSESIEQQLYSLMRRVIQNTIPEEYLDFAIQELDTHIEDAEYTARQPEEPGGRFWYTTYQMSRTFSDSRFRNTKWKNRFPVNWNLLFREMGIDGLIDPGMGIIHDNEPTQAVTFSVKSIRNKDRVANKYSPQKIEHQKILRQLKSGTVEDQFDIIKRKPSWLQHLPNPDKELLLKLLDFDKSHVYNIVTMHGLDDELQIAAVRKDPRAVQWMSDPTEEAQLLAVQAKPEYIMYIDSPTKTVQYAAVKQKPEVYHRIKNPDPQITDFVQNSKP